jgi:hypothetical protein
MYYSAADSHELKEMISLSTDGALASIFIGKVQADKLMAKLSLSFLGLPVKVK